MRALLQRVKSASVEVDGKCISEIRRGIVVFLGINQSDQASDSEQLYEKIIHLRIFDDEQGKMNLSVLEVGAEILVVSQFTLYGDCKKGRRPSFDEAMKPQGAKMLYEHFLRGLSSFGLKIKSGRFQEYMQIHLINDGPVTFMLESK
jgi:D-tyrosyl-tRNA(Tyr) deacylase